MKQAALIILVTLLVLTGGSVFLSRQLTNKTAAPSGKLVETQMPEINPELTLLPEVTQVSVGDQVVFTVSITAGTNQVIGTETYLNFKPDVLTNVRLAPGDLFNDPEELLKVIDPVQGKISYALGTLTPKAGNGQVFKISADLIASPTTTQNVLTFDQQNTKVALMSADGQTRYDEQQIKVIFKEVPISVLP